MRHVMLVFALLLAAACGGADSDDAASTDGFERSMHTMMRDMDEPDRADFCVEASVLGRDGTLKALKAGWESSTDEPFYDDGAAEVVWEWCDEIEADTPDDW